ncbi:hypothetical protein J2W28_006952 [Variovorax boronicumulans]|nr:hypothetical protein [Variovorax boronicumulans]MDP9996469.1 hypothetical protein [Variovorax boronicumulans]MDQ0007773.1 hypothetical protein [Variovorax boronicumulans]
METSVFCRACGQSLRLKAAACPHCGAPQHLQPTTTASAPPGSPALAIVSCVLGVLMLLAVLTDGFPSDRDELLGAFGLTLTAVVCAGLSIYHRNPGRIAAVGGLVTAGIGLLICIANL